MSTPQLFDPLNVLASFKGFQLTGFAPGTYIAAARNEDAFKIQVGSGGTVARTRNPNKSGRITFTLQQTSPSNDQLSAIAADDEATGKGVGALLIKDLLGRTVVEAPNAWIVKLPDVEFSNEAGTRQWVLECDQLIMTVAGNA